MNSITLSGAQKANKGFTLVEILITVAIVAILASIAMPAYNSYIAKSEIRSVQADLLALSLSFENQYQRTLAYPVLDAGDRADLAKIKAKFKGWSPATTDNFSFKLETNEADAYTLTAEGNTGSRQAGCKVSLTHTNVRTTNGCKYVSGGNWL